MDMFIKMFSATVLDDDSKLCSILQADSRRHHLVQQIWCINCLAI